jgi:hypothetical protein
MTATEMRPPGRPPQGRRLRALLLLAGPRLLAELPVGLYHRYFANTGANCGYLWAIAAACLLSPNVSW